ncbi:MAG: 12-oxophytodienoate reductase [Acidobacteriota bacterium]|nr:12-oxophytodienoate reductase [Acidobacteriota bacterium]
MPTLDLAPLFTPFAIKGLKLPNRFVMPGMQRQWCDDGVPQPRLAEYYRQRVEGGVGLIITESCAVDHPSSTQTPMFCRINDSTMRAWQRCFDAVNRAGGRMLLQLWHEGAMRKEGDNGYYAQFPTLSPSGLVHAGKPNGRAASVEDLEAIRDAFVRGALAARELGAAGAEVHACHGYLLDQFLWAETNRRTDGYGGDDIRDRVRFPAEIVAAIRAAVGENFPISFRFSQWKEVNYKARIAPTPDDLRTMLGILRAAGVDVFHASARYFWIPEWPDSDWGVAGWTKSHTDAPVIGVGSVGLDTDVMDNFFGKEAKSTGEAGLQELLRRFNNGEFDLISVGRSLIGDAAWVNKVRDGRLSEIRMFTKKDVIGDLEVEGFVADAQAKEK